MTGVIEKQKLTKQVETIDYKPADAGDIEAVPSDLDTMLNKYEALLAEERNPKHGVKVECQHVKSSIPVSAAKAMKPRVRHKNRLQQNNNY